jgi:hypothetical protein
MVVSILVLVERHEIKGRLNSKGPGTVLSVSTDGLWKEDRITSVPGQTEIQS